MVVKLNQKEESPIYNAIQQEALVNILELKGLVSKAELLEEIKILTDKRMLVEKEKRIDKGEYRNDVTDQEVLTMLKQIVPPDILEKLDFLARRGDVLEGPISLQNFLLRIFIEKTLSYGRSLGISLAHEKRKNQKEALKKAEEKKGTAP